MRKIGGAFLAAVLLLAGAGAARAEDPQEGYYYPKPKVVETYQARVATLPDSDRSRRIGFVTALSKEFDARPYPPNYLVFAKGDEADKLIITGMIDGQFNTVYRARALLADLTASARLTEFFQKNAIAEYATFLDFLKLLGFKQVTVTDGVAFAEQIRIE
ncbi:MAG TPA: molybdopterin-guanine dinucleotide biosynthesis protein A [Dongiaceae bacterium]|nr:molybdopterin-guanine dinucleotide biosynthesis protein A [Dongiaceae bacterium]